MLIVSEESCRRVIGHAEAFDAVDGVFAAMAAGVAYNFPVVREAIGQADALFGFKSGFDRSRLVLGLKAGGYWPANGERGLTNHQSTVFLFDADSGRPKAMVAANHLTAMRTAAASAVSIKYLARKDSRVLGIVGAGFQSTFQLRAAIAQGNFEKVVGWNRRPQMLGRLEEVAADLGLPFEPVDLERLGAEADVIITITSSFAPLLLRDQVRPGTHLACMGTDTAGKQELDPALVAAATLFTDELAQSVAIGECQHAVAAGLVRREAITPIGEVVNGTHPGRRNDREITLFDGTGVGLQDLSIAAAAVELALKTGAAVDVQV